MTLQPPSYKLVLGSGLVKTTALRERRISHLLEQRHILNLESQKGRKGKSLRRPPLGFWTDPFGRPESKLQVLSQEVDSEFLGPCAGI